MMYRLIFLTGNLKGQRITVDSEPMTLGRDADCSINITDSEVASKHAELEHNILTGLRINDLGSMNKILVNNHEVRESHLKHGDIVELGRTRFLVQAAVETDPTKSAPNRRRRHISLTPLLIIIPMLVIIYGVVSFCQKIIRESSQTIPAPIVTSLSTSNVVHPQTPITITKPEIIRPEEKLTNSPPANPPPAQESLKPISDEIRQMREDLVGIKQTVKELAVKPPTPAISTATASVKQVSLITTQHPPQQVNTIITANSVPKPKPPAPDKVERSDPKIKISYLEQQKFKENDDFDEMRVITVGLQREWPVKNMDDDAVKVEITFFDQSDDTKSIVPTRAITPTKPLKPTQWLQDTQSTVTAAYVIPKGSRTISSQTSSLEQFYGYVVRVYYHNTLQNEDARPKNLLQYSSGTLRKQNSPDNMSKTNKE